MVYEVIVDISNSETDKVFDYLSPFPVEKGERVLVPFGRRQVEGFVIGVKEKSDCRYDLKDIMVRLDDRPVILPEMIELAAHMRATDLRLIDCLRLFVPSKLRGGRVKALTRNFLYFDDSRTLEEALGEVKPSAKAQRAILTELYDLRFAPEARISEKHSASAVKALVEKGLLIRKSTELNRTPEGMIYDGKRVELTDGQREAVGKIAEGAPGTYLIHGVTGSGKTEIYLNLIEKTLAEGKTAIMLVPEISLTPQMLGIFRARFGDMVSVLHSGLSDGERYDEWRRLLTGSARVALGARSAVFAPLKGIGVIIIDEEHDSSYVSENNPRYFTSEIAEFRRAYNGAKLVLGSATPSIETYYKAVKGEYTLITLDKRINRMKLPELETVDMRDEIRAGNTGIFSARLLSGLEQTLKDGNQAMLFLNRRGYASFLRCRSCGFVPKCPDCDVSLTYHIEDDTLRCHYCGARFKSIDACPKCGYTDLKEGKTGTEKLEEETKRIFPDARVIRMDNDTTRLRDAYTDILTKFSSGEADILVGTQMIAKGHDFKDVTLVGIIDADIALYYSDYRSAERTFQLITQVSGRAGRADKAGKVVMQTYSPNHYVYRFAKSYDYRGFYDNEIRARELTKYPPFTKIVRLLVLSDAEELARSGARSLAAEVVTLKNERAGIMRVQVMQSAIKRLKSYYRYQVVIWIDCDAEDEICPLLYAAAGRASTGKVSVFTEINPQQML